ncbi:MAG TPA: hypothetical protein VI456_12905 [Polyangia bacterium]
MTAEALVPAPAPAPPRTFFRRHRLKIIPLGILGILAGTGGLWTLVTLTYSYSDGDRIGYVQKLSHRGWLCRTWEGELAMMPLPGVPPQIFNFTVRDEAVAKRVKEAEGRRVALHYQEKRGVPSSCFGDTSYFISDVRVLFP